MCWYLDWRGRGPCHLAGLGGHCLLWPSCWHSHQEPSVLRLNWASEPRQSRLAGLAGHKPERRELNEGQLLTVWLLVDAQQRYLAGRLQRRQQQQRLPLLVPDGQVLFDGWPGWIAVGVTGGGLFYDWHPLQHCSSERRGDFKAWLHKDKSSKVKTQDKKDMKKKRKKLEDKKTK